MFYHEYLIYLSLINEMNDTNSSVGSDDDIALKYQKLASEFAKVVFGFYF